MVDNVAKIKEALNVLKGSGRVASEIADVKTIPTSMENINDILFGCGGLPLGRIIEIYAKESVGKSTFAYWLIGQIQAAGYNAALWDAEGAYVPAYGKACGIDNDRLILPDFHNGEEALGQMKLLAASGLIHLGVADAMPAFQPTINIEQIAGEKLKMNQSLARAKMYTEFFNSLMGGFKIKQPGKGEKFVKDAQGRIFRKIYQTETTFIFINHAKVKIGVMFGDRTYTPGGDAINFASAMRLGMTLMKSKKKKKTHELQFKIIKVRAVKNKLAVPFGEVLFKMFPDGHLEPFTGKIRSKEDDEESEEDELEEGAEFGKTTSDQDKETEKEQKIEAGITEGEETTEDNDW